MNGLLTINEVCKRLKVSRVTIYDWMNSGKLKAIKFGKGVRIREEDVAALGQEWKSRKKKPASRKVKKGGTAKTKSSLPLVSVKGWGSLLEDAKEVNVEIEKSAGKILKYGEILKERGISDSKIERAMKQLRLALVKSWKGLGQMERTIIEMEKKRRGKHEDATER